MIELKNASKKYQRGAQEVHALRDVSLRIKRGEFLSVMGRAARARARS